MDDGEDTLDGTQSVEAVSVSIRIRPLNDREKKARRRTSQTTTAAASANDPGAHTPLRARVHT